MAETSSICSFDPDHDSAPAGPAAAQDDWLELAVEVEGIDAETVADILRQACAGGAAIEPSYRFDAASDAYVVDGDAPALVRGYLPAGSDVRRLRRSLQLALAAAPLLSPPRWRRLRRLREASWRDSWKRYFGLQRIGSRLVVKPSWVSYESAANEAVIEIDPGMAFGTGQHPTTALCLRALESAVRPGIRVLDVGCGTGILAIAAAKLGASSVLAVDIDPQAAQAASRNVVTNGVGKVVDVREGTLDDSAGSFHLIVANIGALTLERLASAVSRSLAPSGVAILSGFLEDAVQGLAQAYEAAGLTVRRVEGDGVWRAMVCEQA